MEALESSEQSCGERVWNPHDGGLLFMVPYNEMDQQSAPDGPESEGITQIRCISQPLQAISSPRSSMF